jgi:hypothetical protein
MLVSKQLPSVLSAFALPVLCSGQPRGACLSLRDIFWCLASLSAYPCVCCFGSAELGISGLRCLAIAVLCLRVGAFCSEPLRFFQCMLGRHLLRDVVFSSRGVHPYVRVNHMD